MSQMGQSRRFGTQPVTSGLPQTTDFARPVRLVRFVQIRDISPVGLPSDLSYNPIEVGL